MEAKRAKGRTRPSAHPLQDMAKALSHPLRVRILEGVNERAMSPVEFEREYGGAPLGTISYHFRELAKFGCLELVEELPRRGAVEHVFQATTRASFTDEQWREVPEGERSAITATILQGFIAKASTALSAGTFDERPDSHFSWLAMQVDEAGWAELTALLAATLSEAEDIRVRAGERLVGNGNQGFRVTFSTAGFETPPLERRVES